MSANRIHEERVTNSSNVRVLDSIKTASAPNTINGVEGIIWVLSSGDHETMVLLPKDICEELALALLAKTQRFWGRNLSDGELMDYARRLQ